MIGTYPEQPRAGQLGMTIGIRDNTDPDEVARLPGMVALTFKDQITTTRSTGAAGRLPPQTPMCDCG